MSLAFQHQPAEDLRRLVNATRFLAAILSIGFVCGTVSAQEKEQVQDPGRNAKNESATEKYRLIWTTDPATEAVLGWNQMSEDPATVHFSTEDLGRSADQYPYRVEVEHQVSYDGMTNCFAKLTGLQADTRYFLCLKDKKGVSRRFQFVTAPDQPKAFTFIAGGDSRNFRDVRIETNKLCAKLKPLFVSFTGDMINKDEAKQWQEWLDDWQHTTSEDGRLIPIVAYRGNHERRAETIPNVFHTPKDVYYAFSIGGDLCRSLVLNSEIPATGPQEEWLDEELAASAPTHTHLIAGYHKPMRPHVSKKSEGANPMNWADNFYRYGVDLVLESDSHVMKRTLPLKPDPQGHEGFSISLDDPQATVYIGEGCWGAPLRAADDAKPWTLDSASFNGFDWIQVSPEHIRVKTVKTENQVQVKSVKEISSYATPADLKLWSPESGEVLEISADRSE